MLITQMWWTIVLRLIYTLAVLANSECRLAGHSRTIYVAVYGQEIIARLRKIKKLNETYL